MAELTPMKRQYNEIKAQYKDCLLFFRLGDFYEMFNEDAVLASKELDLALTTRDRSVENPDERMPMCGVPYHSAEAYIARLICKGYKVAICEQTEDPALAKGLVKRDVIRIITPGTVTESSMLEEGRSNWLAAVLLRRLRKRRAPPPRQRAGALLPARGPALPRRARAGGSVGFCHEKALGHARAGRGEL